uniref:Uncharacterized protein n=1 Tax=Proboscia inermis TaxID=420281 RepID=A0A7S0GM01_9STRA|mmetsp:Transcript_51947/g.52356  ORF Transcript_51947/g.52356 Transcript_51947/m.52356 type:complete len:341 (+) Transcript_51947:143-1165(+)
MKIPGSPVTLKWLAAAAKVAHNLKRVVKLKNAEKRAIALSVARATLSVAKASSLGLLPGKTDECVEARFAMLSILRHAGGQAIMRFVEEEQLSPLEVKVLEEMYRIGSTHGDRWCMYKLYPWLFTLVKSVVANDDLDFHVDARGEGVLQTYPEIQARQPNTLEVLNGVLIKAPDIGQCNQHGDELYAGAENVNAITYEINITADKRRYNVGLGCYVGRDLKTRFCFHPGMDGGHFRIEGLREGHGWNNDIGFTPPDWEELQNEICGRRGTKFTIRLSFDGIHSVTLRHPTDPSAVPYTKAFEAPGLWCASEDVSPSFGIYAGDIEGGGHVYYEKFSVKVE